MDLGGAYSADRAAALSGVPRSTVHYWARHEILVPSVSAERVMLWSFADLMGLRTIHWLRQPKRARDGMEIPRSTMRTVRRALRALRALDLALFERGRPTIAVTREGDVLLDPPVRGLQTVDGQRVMSDAIDVIAPFETTEGGRGPDLSAPRPLLRIVPRKLGGEPHVISTRIETQALQALALRGFAQARLVKLYPELSAAAVADALDLEQQLAHNLRPSVAA